VTEHCDRKSVIPLKGNPQPQVTVPAKDLYHDAVKQALIRDGWNITHDPLSLKVGKRDMFIDLGAEKILAAQKGDRKIAVEIKSFIGSSEVEDLRNALGQFIIYKSTLEDIEPDRILYLAVRSRTYQEIFAETIGATLLRKQLLNLIVFDPTEETIVQWIP
jgi:hypothetical protein